MTDLELKTLQWLREHCEEQKERAPSNYEWVDWRNKAWIIDGILDDEKERRELASVDPEENETETENVTENKTESEEIEMSTSEVNGLDYSPIGENAKPTVKEMFRKLYSYRSHIIGATRFGVVVKDNVFCEVTFFASDGKTAYFTSTLFCPGGCLKPGAWYYDDNCVDDVYNLLKGTTKYDPVEIAYADKKIVFKLADRIATIEADGRKGAEIFGKLISYQMDGVIRSTVDLKNVSEITGSYSNGTRRYDSEMQITADDKSFSMDGCKLTVGGVNWKHPMKYYYSHRMEKLFRKNSSVTFSLYELDGSFYFVTRPVGKSEFFLQMLNQDDHKMLTDIYIKGKTDEPKQETKPEPEPIKEEETEMTATEIKPAQESGDFTFSVSTSPTEFSYIGLDYKQPTDKKTPEPVECRRPDLGEFIQGNKTYELYRNDELQRYRLTFKRHLTKDERDFLWTNKWTWRKEFKCYQWGFTKNGDEAARNAIEYFEKR